MLHVPHGAPDLDGGPVGRPVGHALADGALVVRELHDDGVLVHEVQGDQRAPHALEADGMRLVHDGHAVGMLVYLPDILLGALRPPRGGVARSLERLLVRIAPVPAFVHHST